jgi:hypothetical protein
MLDDKNMNLRRVSGSFEKGAYFASILLAKLISLDLNSFEIDFAKYISFSLKG